MGFLNINQGLDKIREITSPQDLISYGITYLDDSLEGISRDDLILITAKTGGGKTEFATNIAYSAAKQKKKVLYFALEAHTAEIYARIKFKKLSQAYYIANLKEEKPDYLKWIRGRQPFLNKFDLEIDQELKRELETLECYHTDKSFTADKLESILSTKGEACDLIIIDHLHYFDFSDENENKAMKNAVKQIKNVVSFFRKPVIIVTQLRKADKYSGQLLPGIDDIHGSSDIGKIATTIIVTAPARDVEQTQSYLFPTFFRIIKNRTSGARTHFTALCSYDNQKNEYSGRYLLGVLKNNDTEFEKVELMKYPSWITRSSL